MKVVFRSTWVVILVLGVCVNTERKAALSKKTPHTLASLSLNSAALLHIRDFQKDFESTVAQSEMLCV